jgi:hypothetical protein
MLVNASTVWKSKNKPARGTKNTDDPNLPIVPTIPERSGMRKKGRRTLLQNLD